MPPVLETGLLEQTVLLVHGPSNGRRELCSAGGLPVGFVQRSKEGPCWWRWLRPVLAIHETEDEPLVFTVQRALTILPRREVHDAEGELVGVLALPWLLDRWGRPVVRVGFDPRGEGTFRTPAGEMLGGWSVSDDALELRFGTTVQQEPLVKMLLLATVLHEPVANGRM